MPRRSFSGGGHLAYNTPAMTKKQKVLIIVGSTSSGKSALAVKLAQKFDGEVISADSRQVYRGLNIGTGKITKREMKGVSHHLLDVASPKKVFSADNYVNLAKKVIEDVSKRGKLPIVAGGTGFYVDALVGRVAFPNVPPNAKLRAQLDRKSAAQLFAMLKKKDPRRARSMDTPSERNNKVRLIRALEIAATLRRPRPVPRSDLSTGRGKYDVFWIGIALPMRTLEKKIASRLFARIKQGMVAEVKRLHAGGLSYKRMEELGLEYRSLARFLQGKITREEMADELNRAIRKYAKRQVVYWKRNKDILWFKDAGAARISKTIRNWLEN